MKIAGIVAEYNPFHTGHAYQIACTRAQLGEDCAIAAVMSGHWVQGGRPAIADKWTRTRLALLGGADLVLELPTVWAVSSAETFARGAVGLLAAAQVVDVLSFGSECGDADKLQRAAICLNSPEYEAVLRRLVEGGTPFAAARQGAVEGLLGPELAELLSTPNNNLGVEYIRALDRLSRDIRPMTIRREGAPHDSLMRGAERPRFCSATQLRAFLEGEDWAALAPYLPKNGLEVLRAGWSGPSLERAERGLLARLRTMTAEDWANIPDSGAGEGLPPRLERAGKQCRSRPAQPPYLRVLGFNSRGQAVLKEMKERAHLPILTKPAHARSLDGPGRRLFDLEARCTDLYDLCLEAVPTPGREWTTSPVRF